jgi:enterochelin esterase family protein
MKKIVGIGWLIFLLAACNDKDSPGVVEDPIPEKFSDFLFLIEDKDPQARQLLVERFIDSLDTSPMIEGDTSAYFLYVGNVNRVSIAGDFNGWRPGFNFQQIDTTGLWYRNLLFEPNARMDYKIVVDGTNWLLDPLNPNRIAGGFGFNSELAMPQYVQPWEIINNPEASEGELIDDQLASQQMQKNFMLKVYLPPGYDSSSEYPVAYFQDGTDYINFGNATTILDNLIHHSMIEPLIGVFVVPNDRNVEYAFEERFLYRDFFVEELVPYIDSNYATRATPDQRAVIGDSYGGNISAIIAFSRPEVFGNCGIHSGAFQPNNFNTNQLVMDGKKKEIKVASVWGTYEGASLPANMRQVRDYLVEMEYDIFWKELPEGHSWGLWRATTDDMLIFFFPGN